MILLRRRRPAPKNGVSGVLLATALVAGVSLRGQPVKPPAPEPVIDSGTVFRSDTRVVDLHATVMDSSGHLVTNLPRQAFTVYENGVQQMITNFKREDAPVSMGLIVDNSGSMRDKRSKVEAAALTLVKDSNPQDEVFVVNFNDEAYKDLPHGKDFTSDIKEMEEALKRIDSRGGTAMRDAIRFSIDHLKEKAHREKKVLVVVTDGNDNSSLVTLQNVVRASQQSGVLIYPVGLLSEEVPEEARRAQQALGALAEATGGETFFPKEVSEVERIAHTVAHNIRNQYSIVYTPADQSMDGTFRQIKVTVNAPGSLTVRSRSGYYATPDQAVGSTRAPAR